MATFKQYIRKRRLRRKRRTKSGKRRARAEAIKPGMVIALSAVRQGVRGRYCRVTRGADHSGCMSTKPQSFVVMDAGRGYIAFCVNAHRRQCYAGPVPKAKRLQAVMDPSIFGSKHFKLKSYDGKYCSVRQGAMVCRHSNRSASVFRWKCLRGCSKQSRRAFFEQQAIRLGEKRKSSQWYDTDLGESQGTDGGIWFAGA